MPAKTEKSNVKAKPAAKKTVRKPAAKKTAAAKTRTTRTTAKTKAVKTKTTTRRAPAKKPTTGARTGTKRKSRAPKPVGLECTYSGKVFRSRLEARWALYLDLLGIDWDYEPCFYKVSDSLYYLPDFYLPNQRLWLEVKGAPFFDAESFAKVVNSVAGKRPIPTRDAPYQAAGTIIMGGSFQSLGTNMPEHVAVTSATSGKASFKRMSWAQTPNGWTPVLGIEVDSAKATGTKASRRPTADKTKMILEPPLLPGVSDPLVVHAYTVASKATFDVASKSLIIPLAEQAVLAARRSGRYLPPGL